MADEPEEVEIEVETEACPDWFELKDGYIVAARGWGDVQDHFGAPLIRIRMSGVVEVLMSTDGNGETWAWRPVDKLKVPAEVLGIRGCKPTG